MTLETLRGTLPDYARDIKLNLGAIAQIQSLTPQQLWGSVLVSALATRQGRLIQAARATADEHLNADAIKAAYGAAAIMGMNNIYYRFTHLVGDHSYSSLPARLRMQIISQPGVEKVDFELWSLAASAVNGCGRCLEAHEKVLRQHGVTQEAIQDAARIAAIVHAAAAVLDAEAAAPLTAAA